MPNVNSALDSLMNLFTPTPGGKFFLGRGDNPAIVVPRDSIDGTMAKLYRDRRMVYIHNESGATGFAKLNPGIGIDYQDYSFGAARLPVMTEIKDGIRYISEIAPEGLVMLGGKTLTERTTQTLYAHGIEQLTLLRGAPTNPPSLSVRVDGTWIYRDPYTNGRGVFQTDTIDLAADIDALTANQHQLAIICFDAVNHDLVRVLNTASTKPTGKTLPCPEEFGSYDVIAIDTGDYVPIVAVYLYDAQTEITENSFYRVYPMRPIFNGDTRLLMLPAASSGNIVTDALDANRMFYQLYAESGTTDLLKDITPIEDRQMLFLQAGSGQTISIRHNEGNIYLNGEADFNLTGEKTLLLVHDGTNWSDVGIGGGTGTPSPLTTKGDIYVHDGSDDVRLPVGTDGYVLTADSGATEGVAWSPLATGSAKTRRVQEVILDTTLSTTASYIDITVPSDCVDVHIIVEGRSDASNQYTDMAMYFNSDTTQTNYSTARMYGGAADGADVSNNDQYVFAIAGNTATANMYFKTIIDIVDAKSGHLKHAHIYTAPSDYGKFDYVQYNILTWYSTSAITTIRLDPYDGSNFAAGSRVRAMAWREESIGSGSQPYILLRDEKAQNTAGGTFTSGSWQVRDIAEISDTSGLCSVSSNQITLAAGTYRMQISCPAYSVNNHQCRLYNVTDASVIAYGAIAYSQQTLNTCTTTSNLSYKFTIASTKVLEIQHRCQATQATDGLGTLCNFGTEVYTVAEFWKEL